MMLTVSEARKIVRVGDTVQFGGKTGEVGCVHGNDKFYWKKGIRGGNTCLEHDTEFQFGGPGGEFENSAIVLIQTSKHQAMSIVKKVGNMFKKLTDKATQDLSAAGYINGDLELTDKAKNAAIEHYFLANKDVFAKLAADEIAEAEKEAKK